MAVMHIACKLPIKITEEEEEEEEEGTLLCISSTLCGAVQLCIMNTKK